ncbi:MAG: discoidin domain-containing protein [Calditrichaeota bacterium]|nr:MAG: discoidin domain-containing protein [Calditrichota bacterium]
MLLLLGAAFQPSGTTTAAPADEKMTPIPLVLPRPMFVGTPTPINVEHLEKLSGKARPPFLAPAGTVNVALNKPVTASDDMPVIGELDMVTDGDKEASDGSYVELGPFQQWVQVDLGATQTIYAIVMWHFHKQPRVYKDVVVMAADDADFTKNVQIVYNNDIDNSLGKGKGTDFHYVETNEGRLVDCKGIKARYIRSYSSGNTSNDLNHWIELEVYGKPVK